jgi:signal transduction histidine kinase
MQSLQARLGVSLAISLIALFILEWFVVSPAIRKLTDHYVTSRLRLNAARLQTLVNLTEDGKPVVDISDMELLYQRPLSGHYFQVMTARGDTVQSQSMWEKSFDVPMVSPGELRRTQVPGPTGQQLLVLISGFEKQGHPLTLAIAEDIAPFMREFGQFQNAYMLASLLILASLIAIQSLIVRLSFRPLHRVRQDISRLERGEINHLGESVPTEVRPLVQEMNRLLRVLEERLRRSRNALGNLAHALKTPLTLVMQLAEHEEMERAPDARAQLSKYTTILHHRLERELRRARLAGGASVSQRLVLNDEIPPLVETLRSLYREMDLDIVCRIPKHTVFRGDREDFLELLGNLLNNACQWARHQIAVTIDHTSWLYVMVEDDGPGCPADVLQYLTQRGLRLDESMPGHGLGLSICRDIVQQYHGDIVFGRSSQLGGFLVEVTLLNEQSSEG